MWPLGLPQTMFRYAIWHGSWDAWGGHPLDSAVLGGLVWSMPSPAQEGHQGVEAALGRLCPCPGPTLV